MVKRLEGQFLRTLERAAAGAISLERLRSALEEVDAQRETLKADSSPQPELADAIAYSDASRLLDSWESLDRDALGYIIRATVSESRWGTNLAT